MEEKKVIDYLRGLLDSGTLKAGDRLPAERKLAEDLGISRGYVRSAYQKMEFYGIVKTYPQSGSIIAEQSTQMLAYMLSGLSSVDSFDFKSLVHVRILLELEAVKLCAKNRTEEDLELIRKACEAIDPAAEGLDRVQRDFEFHQAIARASHNPVIASLLLVITPDVLDYYRQHRICMESAKKVDEEHRALYDAISAANPALAARILREHLRDIKKFAEKN